MTDDEVIERCVQDQVRANQDAIDEASALALRRGLCGVRWWPNPNGTVTAEVHLSVPYMGDPPIPVRTEGATMKNRIVASAVGIVMLAWPSPIAAADTSAPSYDGGRVHPGNPVMRVDLNLVRCLPDGSARYRVVVFNRGKGARHLNYYWRETLYGPGGAGEISMSAKNTGSLRFEVLPGNGLMDLWFYPRYQWEQKSYAFAQVVNPCG